MPFPHPLLNLLFWIIIAAIVLWSIQRLSGPNGPLDATMALVARVVIIAALAIYAVIVIARLLGVSVG